MSYAGYEYNADTYGGGGGGGGYGAGGFLQGANDGYGISGGPQMMSPPGGKTSRDQKTLLPITVAQLLKAGQDEPDDAFRIDGMELHQVKIVGQILDVEESATTRLYKVDDGTGVLGCRVFVESDENDYQQERRMLCQKGAYVRVVGQVREYQGQRHLSVHDMRPIKEGNELTHHLLEAIYVHCCNTKARPNSKAGGMGMGGMGMGMGGMMQAGGSFAGQGGYGQPAGMGMGGSGGLSGVQQAVLSVFQQDTSSDAGVDVAQVVRQLSVQNITPHQVKEAVDFLANEGHIYTTTDETHYKATG